MTRTPDCCSDHDPDSLTLAEARKRILDVCPRIPGGQWLPLRDALGCVLKSDVVAPIDVPPYVNSAMDGYAIASADLPDSGEKRFPLAGRSLAGHPFVERLPTGHAVRIMTGAVVPEGADLVVMQEHCRADGDAVLIGSGPRKGQHLRYPGDDIGKGATVLGQGRVLKAADLGLLASLGIRQVEIVRSPRVAFFSTGDELVTVGRQLAPGEIYDSNRYTLHAMLTDARCEPIDLGVARDDPDELEQVLLRAAASADVVITTGGVSVGDADYVKDVLERRGLVNFWKIAMKPGRPLTFGRVDSALFFGLPGNPVSVMATFYQLVLPALRRMRGELDPTPLTLKIRCANELRKQPGRVEFQRGVLREDNGNLIVESTGQQDSHILSSMSRADCFIVLPAESNGAAAGDLVDVQLVSTR